MISAIDVDKDGHINYYEFIAATMNSNLYVNEIKAKNVFEIFDKKHHGYLGKEEISEAIGDYSDDSQKDA